MENQWPAALVFAGPVSRGTLTRLPGLTTHLRWIKSSSVATASRAVRALRAGRAVRDYLGLSEAYIVLVSTPAGSLPEITRQLAQSGLEWHDRIVVLYDSDADCRALQPLSDRGAAVASLNYHRRPEQFVVEGHTRAV